MKERSKRDIFADKLYEWLGPGGILDKITIEVIKIGVVFALIYFGLRSLLNQKNNDHLINENRRPTPTLIIDNYNNSP
ncbi:MAG: hypothetical protein N2593_04100 [Patescibacteria group bacterium]|nr:hypothetical protein [Patescibacteria group bacterium]